MDAKPASIAFYTRLGFIDVDVPREGQVVGDPRPLFLSIDVIAKALAR